MASHEVDGEVVGIGAGVREGHRGARVGLCSAPSRDDPYRTGGESGVGAGVQMVGGAEFVQDAILVKKHHPHTHGLFCLIIILETLHSLSTYLYER